MSFYLHLLELLTRIELVTSSLPRKCSTTELQQHDSSESGAEDGAQTRDPQLGRLVLYRLSYFRVNVKPRGGGQRWIRTTEGVRQQIYSLPHLATLVFAPAPSSCAVEPRFRAFDLQSLCSRLDSKPSQNGCKGTYYFRNRKIFCDFF